MEQPMPRRTTKSAGPHPLDIAVGKRVRLRRLQLSMSQSELAQQIGVAFQQVQKYETGANRISCSKLAEMADALDCPITFFFSDENEHHTEMNLADKARRSRARPGRAAGDRRRQSRRPQPVLQVPGAIGGLDGGAVGGNVAVAMR